MDIRKTGAFTAMLVSEYARTILRMTTVTCAMVLIADFDFARAQPSAVMPRIDHIVVVIMENHTYSDIFNNPKAPFINALSNYGVTFTHSHGVAHPSQPNYFALFSGSTQGINDDFDHSIAAPNLALELQKKGKRFIGYSEDASPRKHNPWESFRGSEGFGRSFLKFPTDFDELPEVSFVVPDLKDDMHDGSIEQADRWLAKNLARYRRYCDGQNSLLILTFDEGDYQSDNRIFTVFYGSPVTPQHTGEAIDHYSVLRTIEAIEAIAPLGETAKVKPIEGIWTPSAELSHKLR
jgi:phosphatidylinositol-3-phosphatase